MRTPDPLKRVLRFRIIHNGLGTLPQQSWLLQSLSRGQVSCIRCSKILNFKLSINGQYEATNCSSLYKTVAFNLIS